MFHNLAIERLTTIWKVHPVLHFDLNNGNYTSEKGLINILNDQLSDYEAIYGRNPYSDEPQLRLRWLIKQAYEFTGQRVVILVDEYDKPLLQSMGDNDLDTSFRNVLKPFYGTLKSEDRYIQFAMLTGVSKFGKLSVFSDLNNIEDISLNKDFSAICGFTEEEIIKTFDTEIDAFALEYKTSRINLIEILRQKYDGYRFSKKSILVYNPFSLLSSIKYKEFNDYWFQTGTPTFLVKLLQQNHYNLANIEGTEMSEDDLYQIDNINVIPLLYQAGYLTIKQYHERRMLYTLGYPNQEVEAAFLNFLLPYYSNVKSDKSKIELSRFIDEMQK